MLTSSGYGAISPVSPAKIYRKTTAVGSRAPAVSTPSNFDSVTLSTVSSKENRFHMDTVGRLSQEVRAATTTGTINTLRQEVASGTYTPDPMAMAARILFLGEGR